MNVNNLNDTYNKHENKNVSVSIIITTIKLCMTKENRKKDEEIY